MNFLNNFAGLLGDDVKLPHYTPGQVLGGVLDVFYFVAGVAAVVVIIIAGYYFVTGGSDPATVAKAKNAILYAVVGLIIIIIAFSITNFIVGAF